MQLKERVEVALERCKEQGEGSDNARFLAQQLLEQGYQVKLRTALGGCATNSSCLRNLRHVFLTCRLDGALRSSPRCMEFALARTRTVAAGMCRR